MSFRLIHIAPELPPTVGGVADYTDILSQRLIEVWNGEVEPILVHAGCESVEEVEVDFPVVDLSGTCSATAVAETVRRLSRKADQGAGVLLEYAGYGYSRHGAPLWLLRGLQRVCGGEDGLPLVTIFHELYAGSLRPWERAFWTFPLQYYVARRLARLSGGMLASYEGTAEWLEQKANGVPVHVSPSFSNVGEPDSLPPYASREPYAVCFGTSERKAETYEQHGDRLCQLLTQADVERIVDIGSEVPRETYSHLRIEVDTKGILPKEKVSAHLRAASVGVLKHPLHCLTKSGIWASYAAHGIPTILAAERQPTDELSEGHHFLLVGSQASDIRRFESISQNVRDWYTRKSCSRCAAERVKKSFNYCIYDREAEKRD